MGRALRVLLTISGIVLAVGFCVLHFSEFTTASGQPGTRTTIGLPHSPWLVLEWSGDAFQQHVGLANWSIACGVAAYLCFRISAYLRRRTAPQP